MPRSLNKTRSAAHARPFLSAELIKLKVAICEFQHHKKLKICNHEWLTCRILLIRFPSTSTVGISAKGGMVQSANVEGSPHQHVQRWLWLGRQPAAPPPAQRAGACRAATVRPGIVWVALSHVSPGRPLPAALAHAPVLQC